MILSHSTILIPAYISILISICLYPIPYFNTNIIKQPLFISISVSRIILLILSNIIYIFIRYNNILTDSKLIFISGIVMLSFGQYLN